MDDRADATTPGRGPPSSRTGRAPGFLLYAASNAWQRDVRVALKPLGITHVQYLILATLESLEHDDGPIMQIELGRRAGIDEMMTSQVVVRLVERGLIQRSPHPTDQRAKSLRLTDLSRGIVAEARVVVAEVDRRFFGCLDNGVVAFNRDLARLLDTDPMRFERNA